jgi:UDP-glucose 4-epimerase
LEVINQFSALLKKDLKYKIGNRREGDLERLVTASSKAEQILGWKAELNLKDMC